MIAAAAMAASSLSVVTNSNRLRRWHRAETSPTAAEGIEPSVEVGAEDDAAETALDPICGMTVDPTAAAAHRTVDGRDYYFCSDNCAGAFDAAPEARRDAATQP
jgi:Cu+-exporting ATPase